MAETPVIAQMGRYATVGIALIAGYAALYWTLAVPAGIPALVANTAAFLFTVVAGYVFHSRWTFKGRGGEGRPIGGTARYLAVSLAGYALNSLWVWLIVDLSKASVTVSLLPITLVTPWLSFWANRHWTFDMAEGRGQHRAAGRL